MKYIVTIHIPTIKPNINGIVFSKECALQQLEEIKKRCNVIWSEWIASNLVVKFEVRT